MKKRQGQPGFIDLFCGAGGITEGFTQAGFDHLLANDIDKWAVETIRANHPEANIFLADIEDLSSKIIMESIGVSPGELDVVVGGPPCQGVSMANMQSRILENPKNRLFAEFIRVVRDIQPKVFVMENVEGLLSIGKGMVKDQIVEEFERLGYLVDSRVLTATDYGVPQIRKRVFLVGNRLSIINKFPDPTHGDPDSILGRLEPYVTVGEAISDLPGQRSGEGREIMTYDEEPLTEYQKIMRGECSILSNHITTKNSEIVLERYKYIPEGGNWQNIPDRLLKDYTDKSRCHSSVYKRLVWYKPAITVSNFRKSMFIHPRQDRGLSVREAARLQSFRDDYVFVGPINAKQQQVADAVPPLMAKAVAESVARMLERAAVCDSVSMKLAVI